MKFEIYYKKNNNKKLFQDFENENYTNIGNIKNYIPLYNNFFSLNETNYNGINLNHKNKMVSIIKRETKNIFSCEISDQDENISEKDVFFKFSPLLDPLKYMIGKYQKKNYNCEILPTLPDIYNKNKKLNSEVSEKVHPKIYDPNNSAYIDSFFTYLTSQLLNNHKFFHGIDFYGSFIGLKKNFSIDICDDLEYLAESDFFNENNNNLFTLSDIYDESVFNSLSRNNKKKISISSFKSDISLDSIQGFQKNVEDLFSCSDVINNEGDEADEEVEPEATDITVKTDTVDEELVLDNTEDLLNDILDINNINNINRKNTAEKNKRNSTESSSSTSCSSRSSNTNNEQSDNDDSDTDDSDNDDSDNDESDNETNRLRIKIINDSDDESGDNSGDESEKNQATNLVTNLKVIQNQMNHMLKQLLISFLFS